VYTKKGLQDEEMDSIDTRGDGRLTNPEELDDSAFERMDDFFTARVENYDAHMNKMEDCANGYPLMAGMLPVGASDLLDLGCGTGLELEEIYKIHPNIHVTGIDLTAAMLDKLRAKFPGNPLTLINDSYFNVDFGQEAFDVAISFQTMHHFPREQKLGLYERLHRALRPGGRYVECDYMVTDQALEDQYFAENTRMRAELGVAPGEFYHYDTPMTVDNQITVLQEAGFVKVWMEWRQANTTIVVAEK